MRLLKKLRGELATSLADVEQQLEALGGSASTAKRHDHDIRELLLRVQRHVARQRLRGVWGG